MNNASKLIMLFSFAVLSIISCQENSSIIHREIYDFQDSYSVKNYDDWKLRTRTPLVYKKLDKKHIYNSKDDTLVVYFKLK